ARFWAGVASTLPGVAAAVSVAAGNIAAQVVAEATVADFHGGGVVRMVEDAAADLGNVLGHRAAAYRQCAVVVDAAAVGRGVAGQGAAGDGQGAAVLDPPAIRGNAGSGIAGEGAAANRQRAVVGDAAAVAVVDLEESTSATLAVADRQRLHLTNFRSWYAG